MTAFGVVGDVGSLAAWTDADLGGHVGPFATRPGLRHHDVQRQVANDAEPGHHGFRLA